MVRQTPQRVLIIGDSQRQLQSAVAQAQPGAQITSVATVFDGIGELSVNTYTTILAAAEPIERRPEPAVRMLRQLAGEGKLILFGHPTLEILARKMLECGCDDYIITPANNAELQQLFEGRSLRLASDESDEATAPTRVSSPAASNGSASAVDEAPPVVRRAPAPPPIHETPTAMKAPAVREESDSPEPIAEVASEPSAPARSFVEPLRDEPAQAANHSGAAAVEAHPPSESPASSPHASERFPDLSAGHEYPFDAPPVHSAPAPPQSLPELPFADIFLDALMQSPHSAPQAAIALLNERLAPDVELRLVKKNGEPIEIPPGSSVFSHALRSGTADYGTLHLLTFTTGDHGSVEAILAQLAHLIGKLAALQERHSRLQKLSITDDLTGFYNARYFRHFLGRLVERAKNERFNVTLLLFDIDDFKKYNDQYGHGAGDEILKQTAKLMRRCCREHDLVARIGGDEFAVVFWDKEGPRQPLDPKKPPTASRAPQTPVQMFERFKRLAAGSDFAGLGQSGRGKLSVSGGLAVYPYDARDVPSLIKAADDYLMFKAKKAGKNSVYLVEGNDNGRPKA